MNDAFGETVHRGESTSLHSGPVLAGVHLVRHGEVHNPAHLVYARLPGFELSDRGTAEAAAAAGQLRSSGAVVVASSPLERAVATAEPIAAAVGAPLRTDDRLGEWRLLDRWAGLAWEDLGALFPGEVDGYLTHPDHLPFSRESLAEVASRMAAVVEDLGGLHPGSVAIVVSHQDPIQALRLHLTGRALGELASAKPTHGTVITLTAGEPWLEAGRWDPPRSG